MEYFKSKGRTYQNYVKLLMQTIMIDEEWNTFYNRTNPEELCELLRNIIFKHLILSVLTYQNSQKKSPPLPLGSPVRLLRLLMTEIGSFN